MGGGMFDVEDNIRLGTPARKSPTSSGETTLPTRIELLPQVGQTSGDAWDRYFAKQWAKDMTVQEERQQFANVRQTVRELSAEKNFAEVIDLINAALRNGQYQPWMHQMLGMALRASGADDEAIERALMSRIDLSQDADEIMTMAVYMSRLGLDHRAMQLFRDVATVCPLRPEPYVQALEAAQRIDDAEGIRWAC